MFFNINKCLLKLGLFANLKLHRQLILTTNICWSKPFLNNVISSNCKSGASEILSNGEFGYLFETNNVSDFVSKIILMIKAHRWTVKIFKFSGTIKTA